MKCALAAVGFLNGDVQHNQRVILNVMKGCSGRADVVLFGEAFLQGFYGATFEVAHDRQMALYRVMQFFRRLVELQEHMPLRVPLDSLKRTETALTVHK